MNIAVLNNTCPYCSGQAKTATLYHNELVRSSSLRKCDSCPRGAGSGKEAASISSVEIHMEECVVLPNKRVVPSGKKYHVGGGLEIEVTLPQPGCEECFGQSMKEVEDDKMIEGAELLGLTLRCSCGQRWNESFAEFKRYEVERHEGLAS